MPVQRVCPQASCRRTVLVSESALGGTVRCPYCLQTFGAGSVTSVPPGATAALSAAVPQATPGPTATLDLPANNSGTPASPPPSPAPAETLDDVSAASVASSAPPSAPAAVPIHIGRFQVRQQLGEGTFGVVYRAHDPQLDREVALKVAKPGALETPERVKRFLGEAKAVANLRHPHIVPVFDSGQDGDRYYIASAFIPGGSLEAELESQRQNDGTSKPLDGRRAAQLVRQLAEALAYAHSRNVIHRDIKPANLMLDERGDALLTDFGLAARLEGGERLTQDGSGMGTPAYMAPEQAQGKAEAASDQYSLGCTLYELLTGQTPFAGPPAIQLVLHQTQDPPSPRMVRSKLPRDLETICLKALAKKPAQRFRGCGEMADELRRYLDGEPIHTRRLSLAERAIRWLRKEPKLAGALAATLGLLIAVAVVLALSARQEQRNAEAQKGLREQAEGQTRRADQARQDAEKEAEKARKVAAVMVGMFEASDPLGLNGYSFFTPQHSGEKLTARQVLDHGAQRVVQDFKDQPVIQATLMDTLGNVYRSLGHFKEANTLLRGALELRRRQGMDDLEVASSLHNLGWLHHEQGDFEAAQRLYREGLALRIKHLHPDHLLVATSKFNLAWLLAQWSEQKEAQALFAEVLAIREKQLGPEHRDVGLALFALAFAHIEGGEPAPALPLSTRALQIFLKQEGPEGLSEAVGLFQQAIIQLKLGFPQLAEPAARKCLQLSRKGLGERHLYITPVLWLLAQVLEAQGKDKEADQCYVECLDIGRATLGFAHPKAIIAVHDYARLLARTGRRAEGEKLFQEALEAKRQRYGPDHPFVAEAIFLLADYARGSDGKRAEQLHREADAIWRKAKHMQKTPYVLNLVHWARLLDQQKRYPEAEKLYREALPLVRAKAGAEHAAVANVMADLADNLIDQNKAGEAEALAREALAMCQSASDIPADAKTWVLKTLARSCAAQAKRPQAEAAYRDALAAAQAEKNPRERTANVDSLTETLLGLLLEQDKFAEGGKLLRETPGLSGRHKVKLLERTAQALSRKGSDQAEAQYRETLEFARTALREDPRELERHIQNLATLLTARAAYRDALPLFEELLAAAEKRTGITPWEVSGCLRDVAFARAALGNVSSYQASCAQLVSRSQGSTVPRQVADVVYSCTLLPDAVKDYAPVLRLVKAAAEKYPPDMSLATHLGRAHYRAGDAAAAAKQLAEVIDKTKGGSVRDWLFLAMAHSRLGNADEAARWLQKAAAAKDQKPVLGAPAVTWHAALANQLLHAEAEALLRSKKP